MQETTLRKLRGIALMNWRDPSYRARQARGRASPAFCARRSLTDGQVAQARRLAAEGVPLASVCECLGIPYNVAWNCVRRVTYRHLA